MSIQNSICLTELINKSIIRYDSTKSEILRELLLFQSTQPVESYPIENLYEKFCLLEPMVNNVLTSLRQERIIETKNKKIKLVSKLKEHMEKTIQLLIRHNTIRIPYIEVLQSDKIHFNREEDIIIASLYALRDFKIISQFTRYSYSYSRRGTTVVVGPKTFLYKFMGRSV